MFLPYQDGIKPSKNNMFCIYHNHPHPLSPINYTPLSTANDAHYGIASPSLVPSLSDLTAQLLPHKQANLLYYVNFYLKNSLC